MNILFPVAECVPFAKTGGLADVAGALPLALSRLGHRIDIIIPFYASVPKSIISRSRPATPLAVPLGAEEISAQVLEAAPLAPGLKIYFIRCDTFFDRPGLYGTQEGNYPDNDRRFTFFCRAVMEWAKRKKKPYAIVHGHDWHTGLIPVYLKTLYQSEPALANSQSLLTIHNVAYQGNFPPESFALTGLPGHLFTPSGVEFWGGINFLKAGLMYADRINTVSQTYAQEIQRREFGVDLDGVLRSRRQVLSGIVNGLDEQTWDPVQDSFLPVHFQTGQWEIKQQMKTLLLDEIGLNPLAQEPLLAVISRLDEQKGVDILLGALPLLLQLKIQMVILGTGAKSYHDILWKFKSQFPSKLTLRLTFDNALAHRIYAGADLFLMPSRYEPCGLGQLISMHYGTIPVVRRTGGLADTVKEFNGQTGNGFLFEPYQGAALFMAVRRAVDLYPHQDLWRHLMKNAMETDFSWKRSALAYEALYKDMASSK